MNATSSGISGKFPVIKDITKYTMVRIFGKAGKKTGVSSASRPLRTSRGMSLPSVTSRSLPKSSLGGDWDPVGNNIPVFFL